MKNFKFKKYALPLFAVALIIAGILIMLFSDKYRFRAEPELKEKKLSLEKVNTSERKEIRPQLCKGKLSDNLKAVYETIGENINYTEPQSFWFENVSKDDFKIALEAYVYDHPEVFWIDTKSSFSYYEMAGELEIELRYSITGGELEAAKTEFDNAVQKAFTYVPEKADDLEIEVFINDYLVNHCKYNEKANMCHTSYGALVNNEAVCDGYSQAFQLLCIKMGIECSVTEGTSDFNGESNAGHMWNCVKLDNNWYNTDVTWNDIDSAQFFCERYFYLNLTDKEITENHKFSPMYDKAKLDGSTTFNIFLPECKTDKLKYINIYCVTIKDINDDGQMIASLIKAANNGEKSCTFVIDKSLPYKETCAKIIDEGYINEWINGANHYCKGKKINTNTKAYTYSNQNLITIELNYE